MVSIVMCQEINIFSLKFHEILNIIYKLFFILIQKKILQFQYKILKKNNYRIFNTAKL